MPDKVYKIFSKFLNPNRRRGTPSGRDDSEGDTVGHAQNPTKLSTENVKLFQRQPLRLGNEIRLLRLVPNHGSSTLHGRLVHARLDDSQAQYIAISYCWGTDKREKRLWISNESYVEVTCSVYSILRLLHSEGQQSLYWIDDLCIDHSNLPEKSHQIRLIPKIFATAQKVFAFIGEPSEDSDLAMDFIKFAKMSLSTLNFMKIAGLLDNFPEGVDANMQGLVQLDGMHYPSTHWNALKNLLLRPWFQRSWCVQEVSVGKDVVLRCGEKVVDWEELAYTMAFILQTGLSYLSTVDNKGYVQIEGFQTLQAVFALKESFKEGPFFSLQNCLMFANDFSATIPHDKVFSMLGLARDARDSALDPDYKVPETELYTKVTRYLFSRDKTSLLLHIAGIGHPRILDELPSWVPDFSQRRGSTVLGYREHYANLVISKARFDDPCEMTVTGAFFDEVQELREPMPKICRSHDRTASKQSRADIISWLETSQEWVMIFGRKGASRQDLKVSFWQTLLNGVPLEREFAGQHRNLEEYPEIFEAYMFFLRTTVDLPMSPDIEDISVSALFEEKDGLFKIVMESKGRRLFATKTGSIGLGPAGLLRGDKVIIIDGTITPFLFREARNKSVAHLGDKASHIERNLSPMKGLLVGESYIDGIMKDSERDFGRKQEFVLI